MANQFSINLPVTDGGSVTFTAGVAVYTPPAPTPPPVLPISTAIIWTPALEQNASAWKVEHDAGTPGTSSANPPIPFVSGAQFPFSFTGNGGTRWSCTAATDLTARHFIYDTWFWCDHPELLGELELDINWVDAKGNVTIMGIQWSPSNKRWMWTTIPDKINARWNDSNVAAALSDFPALTWNHIRLASQHDGAGNVTYGGVEVNGVYRPFAASCAGPSVFAGGWTPGVIIPNAQLDGIGSGSLNACFSGLRIGRY